MKGKSLYYIGV